MPEPSSPQVLAIALAQTNQWFADVMLMPNVQLQLIDEMNIQRIARQFLTSIKHRKVDWDWEAMFHKKVKFAARYGCKAWMFAITVRGRAGAMSWGKIDIRPPGYVSIEFLERRPYVRGLRGLAAPAAFQFAKTVAALLDVDQVRLSRPLPELVRYYTRSLGLVRHPVAGRVQYLFAKVNA